MVYGAVVPQLPLRKYVWKVVRAQVESMRKVKVPPSKRRLSLWVGCSNAHGIGRGMESMKRQAVRL
jgi:hypothetical protein